jgi:hypothetical protein
VNPDKNAIQIDMGSIFLAKLCRQAVGWIRTIVSLFADTSVGEILTCCR